MEEQAKQLGIKLSKKNGKMKTEKELQRDINLSMKKKSVEGGKLNILKKLGVEKGLKKTLGKKAVKSIYNVADDAKTAYIKSSRVARPVLRKALVENLQSSLGNLASMVPVAGPVLNEYIQSDAMEKDLSNISKKAGLGYGKTALRTKGTFNNILDKDSSALKTNVVSALTLQDQAVQTPALTRGRGRPRKAVKEMGGSFLMAGERR